MVVGHLDEQRSHVGPVGPCPVRHERRPLDGLAVMDGRPLLPDLDPAATADDDEEPVLWAGLRRQDRARRERELRDPSPRITPDGLLGEAVRPARPMLPAEARTEAQDLHAATRPRRQRRFRAVPRGLGLGRPEDRLRIVADASR